MQFEEGTIVDDLIYDGEQYGGFSFARPPLDLITSHLYLSRLKCSWPAQYTPHGYDDAVILARRQIVGESPATRHIVLEQPHFSLGAANACNMAPVAEDHHHALGTAHVRGKAPSSSADPSSSSRGVAGPSSGFATSQDFIAFDFDEEEDEEEEGGQGEGDKNHPSLDKSRQRCDRSRRLSPKAQGKRRRIDEEKEEDGRDGRGAEAGGDSRPRKRASDRAVESSSSQSRKRERRQMARGTPWCVDVDFDRCRSAIEMLHDELIAFADWISPTREEHLTRKYVIHLIRKAITSQYPDADVQPFGSQNTQLYTPQGDIDLVVISSSMELRPRERVLRSMAACLRRHNLATDVQVIAKAKVPIIKFVCTHGKLKVDISVNQTNGLDAARFVCDWLDRCPSIRPLIMATKLLLSLRGMSEVFSGGLGSYSVICMVISHIQLHPKIQRGEIDPSYNLGVLLLEFLELFGKNFGYDEVGISVARQGSYFGKRARGWQDDRRPYMMCIEDPQDADNDIAKGSFGILGVRQVFGGAFDILSAALCQRQIALQEDQAYARWDDESDSRGGKHKRFDVDEDEQARQALVSSARDGRSASNEKDPQSLLGTLFGVNYEMEKARRDLEALWQSGKLQNLVGRDPPPQSPEAATISVPPPHPHRSPGVEAPRNPQAMRDNASVVGNGKEPSSGHATTRKRPEIVIDTDRSNKRRRQQTTDDETTRTDRLQAAVRNANAVADAVSIRDSSYDTDVEEKTGRVSSDDDEIPGSRLDSRYAQNGKSHSTGNSSASAASRRSRLDQFSQNAPQAYVDDDDEDETQSFASLSPVASRAAPPVLSGAETKGASSARGRNELSRKAAYWASKGNAVGSAAPSGGHDDGVLLNIYE